MTPSTGTNRSYRKMGHESHFLPDTSRPAAQRLAMTCRVVPSNDLAFAPVMATGTLAKYAALEDNSVVCCRARRPFVDEALTSTGWQDNDSKQFERL